MDYLSEIERAKRQLANLGLDPGTLQRARDLADIGRFHREISALEREKRELGDLARRTSRSVASLDGEFLTRSSRLDQQLKDYLAREQKIRDWELRQKQLTNFDKIQNLRTSYDTFQQHLRDLEKASARMRQLDQLQKLAERQNEILRRTERLNRPIVPPRDFRLDNLQRSAAMAFSLRENEFRQIADRVQFVRDRLKRTEEFRTVFDRDKLWGSINAARGTFLAELSESVRTAVVDAASDDEAIEKVATIVAAKLESLPKNGFTRVDVIAAIFGVLSFIAAIYSATVSTWQYNDAKKSGEEQRETSRKIIDLLEKLVENTGDETEDQQPPLYRAERGAEVKSRPRFKSTTVDVLPKNGTVRVIKISHKWVFVEYLGSFNLDARMGWVNKKYLKKVG